MNYLDRTNEPLPLLITEKNCLNYESVFIIDNNFSRPAVVINSPRRPVSFFGIFREQNELHINPKNKPLDYWFNDLFLPKLNGLGFSHHDFASANFVSIGSIEFCLKTSHGNTHLLSVPNLDGTPSKDSIISIDSMAGHRFGTLVSGTNNSTIYIKNTVAHLWPDSDIQPAGHSIYFNESFCNGRFIRSYNIGCVIENSSAIGDSTKDHVTAKFKGVDGLLYTCMNDSNPCGTLDQFSSSGICCLHWRGNKSFYHNKIFQALRSGEQNDKFGVPDGNFILQGILDCSNLPTSVPSVRLESSKTFASKLVVKGGGLPDIYGVVNKSGMYFVEADPV